MNYNSYFTYFHSKLHCNVLHSFCHLQGVGTDPHLAFALPHDSKQTKEKAEDPSLQQLDEEMSIRIGRAGTLSGKPPFMYPHQLLQSVLLFNNKQPILTRDDFRAAATVVSDCLGGSPNVFWVQIRIHS